MELNIGDTVYFKRYPVESIARAADQSYAEAKELFYKKKTPLIVCSTPYGQQKELVTVRPETAYKGDKYYTIYVMLSEISKRKKQMILLRR